MKRTETSRKVFLDGELGKVTDADQSRSKDAIHQAMAGDFMMEILDRFMTVAAEDRRAAEERTSEVISRFSKLITAMTCMTMVIAGATVAMIFRQTSIAHLATVAASRPIETPPAVVQKNNQQQPVLPPVPTAVAAISSPAQIVPLPELPSEQEKEQAVVPVQTRVARSTMKKPRPRPEITSENEETDSEISKPAELW